MTILARSINRMRHGLENAIRGMDGK
jgi:hypothetical protein